MILFRDPDCDNSTQPVVSCQRTEICKNSEFVDPLKLAKGVKAKDAVHSYGYCALSTPNNGSFSYRPRYMAGLSFGVAFGEGKRTFLAAFDTHKAEMHEIADFPYDGPNPAYGASAFDEKNQVRRCW